MVLDIDPISGGNWVRVRAAFGDFVAGQFFERVALGFEGDEFAGGGEAEQGGADVDDRAVAAAWPCRRAFRRRVRRGRGLDRIGRGRRRDRALSEAAASAFVGLVTLFLVRLFRLILLNELDELGCDLASV